MDADDRGVTSALRLGGWLRSLPGAVRLLVTHRVRLRPTNPGHATVVMSDGRAYETFRHTVVQHDDHRHDDHQRSPSPATLQVRFRLRGMGNRHRLRHVVFRRMCVLTIPLFVGVPGFRSMRWLVDPVTGDFAGLYEWDDAPSAQAYTDGLCRVLRVVSVPGTVSHELVPCTTVDGYLAGAVGC